MRRAKGLEPRLAARLAGVETRIGEIYRHAQKRKPAGQMTESRTSGRRARIARGIWRPRRRSAPKRPAAGRGTASVSLRPSIAGPQSQQASSSDSIGPTFPGSWFSFAAFWTAAFWIGTLTSVNRIDFQQRETGMQTDTANGAEKDIVTEIRESMGEIRKGIADLNQPVFPHRDGMGFSQWLGEEETPVVVKRGERVHDLASPRIRPVTRSSRRGRGCRAAADLGRSVQLS